MLDPLIRSSVGIVNAVAKMDAIEPPNKIVAPHSKVRLLKCSNKIATAIAAMHPTISAKRMNLGGNREANGTVLLQFCINATILPEKTLPKVNATQNADVK